MLNKALIAAAAVSILTSGFISSAQAASASVTVRDHRTKVKVRDHRSDRRSEVVKVNRPKLACGQGKEKLWWHGYKAVRAYDCQGASYSYRAMKGNGIFNATMNAYNGRMNIEYVGIAH